MALLLPLGELSAQAPELEWQRCLGGSEGEYSWGIQPTGDGGYAVLGSTESIDGDVSGNHGLHDFWLTKLNAMGTLQWQRCYGGTGNDTSTRLLATSDGGFLLLGSTGSTNGDVTCDDTDVHAWALKVDPAGTVQWQTCLSGDPDGSGAGFGQAVETADGGYLAVGGTFANSGIWQENHGQKDFFATKLNGSGEMQWLHCYGGSWSEDAYAIKPTPDGDFVIAGSGGSPDGQVTTGNQGQIWVIKINADGDLLWNRRMGGSNGPGMGQEARDIVVNPDGTILVAGSVGANDGDISGNHGEHDVWLVLLDANGAILQQRCFGGTGDEYAWAVRAVGQGRYVVGGVTYSNDGDVNGNHGQGDAWVLMVDSNLNLLWQKCLGGSHRDAAYALVRDPNGGTIISGMTVSNDGDVSGYHYGPRSDIWVAKLGSDMDTGIDGLESTGIAVFPSPATDGLHVQLSAPLNANATLVVVDITGRIVYHQLISRGIKAVQVPLESWANGAYCLRLDVGSKLLTTRFVKTKGP